MKVRPHQQRLFFAPPPRDAAAIVCSVMLPRYLFAHCCLPRHASPVRTPLRKFFFRAGYRLRRPRHAAADFSTFARAYAAASGLFRCPAACAITSVYSGRRRPSLAITLRLPRKRTIRHLTAIPAAADATIMPLPFFRPLRHAIFFSFSPPLPFFIFDCAIFHAID